MTKFSKVALTAATGAKMTEEARYDGLTIALHWLVAGLIVLQFILAETWDFFPRPAIHFFIVTHMSFGFILMVAIAARLVWRSAQGRRFAYDGGPVLQLAAKMVHYGLNGLVVLEVCLGVATRWTDNKPLSFFGYLIPSPFGTFSQATGDLVDQIHNITAWTIMVIAALHALAALTHHYVMRDGTLIRMLPSFATTRRR